MTCVRITHIGGPTTLIEVDDWRLLTDPTFDSAGRKYKFGSGEGWRHFKQGREAIEREFARAPEDIRRRVRWLPLGVEVEIAG